MRIPPRISENRRFATPARKLQGYCDAPPRNCVSRVAAAAPAGKAASGPPDKTNRGVVISHGSTWTQARMQRVCLITTCATTSSRPSREAQRFKRSARPFRAALDSCSCAIGERLVPRRRVGNHALRFTESGRLHRNPDTGPGARFVVRTGKQTMRRDVPGRRMRCCLFSASCVCFYSIDCSG
jgi:hypothetical protein